MSKTWIPLLFLAACGTPEPADPDCVTDAQYFETHAAPLLEQRCYGCHNEEGPASSTRYVLEPFDGPNALEANYGRLQALIAATPAEPDLLLQKPVGEVSHGGGTLFHALDAEYAIMHELVARLHIPGQCDHPGDPPITCTPGTIQTGPSPFRRLTATQYQNTIEDLLGLTVPKALQPATASTLEFRTWNSSNPVSNATTESLLLAAEWVTDSLDIDGFLNCSASESEAVCLERAIVSFATRAFRRPLTQAETALVLTYLGTGLSRDETTKMSLQLILNLPQFLYIDPEAGLPLAADPTLAHLDDYAIASRLSYFFLNRPPDDTLRAAAAQGQLHTRAQVKVHAERLAQNPKALDMLTDFHTDWLNLFHLDTAQRDPNHYPQFTPDMLESMRQETNLFMNEVVWSGDADWETLMFSKTTWVDQELATIYGLPDPGPGWHRVTLDDTRPGLLTRSAFLTAHAYTGSSAPVRRGYFVLSELLCQELSVPPDVDMVVPEDSNGATTIRERLVQHQTDATCVVCHDRIDPIGFAFEHYDAIGAWRDHWENGIPVDASGVVNDVAIDGVATLLDTIGRTDEAKACYAKRWMEYAIGRPATQQDLCTLETLKQRFIDSDGSLKSLVIDIAMTDAFLYRPIGDTP